VTGDDFVSSFGATAHDDRMHELVMPEVLTQFGELFWRHVTSPPRYLHELSQLNFHRRVSTVCHLVTKRGHFCRHRVDFRLLLLEKWHGVQHRAWCCFWLAR
jgi:hypothetical protein